MSVSPVGGAVYFVAENTADLYRYRPGTDQVEQLAKLSPTNASGPVLILAENCDDFGQALAGEQYIEAIEQVGDEIVVGTQPSSETFTEIALPAGHQSDSVDELNSRGLVVVRDDGRKSTDS